jgi:TetR/AcrR family transcriptional repressor of nem operon
LTFVDDWSNIRRMNKLETKQTLLQTGLKLIFRQGYNHTGLNEVLEASGVPKGSFYYYFNSKEDFALQVFQHFAERAQSRLDEYLKDESLDPLSRLRAYFEWYTGYLESIECSLGCLAGNLGQELADQNETFRLKVDEVMTLWSNEIATCFRAAQQAGQIDPALDTDELAAFCYNSWQGAMLRMKVTKSLTPLRLFIHTLFDVILKP